MASSPSENLKKIAYDFIDKNKEELNDLSQDIWSHPELNYEEDHAHATLTDFLEKKGFAVKRKYLLDTAFCAEFGSGHPHVAVLCEYDALPEIGHACGHNLIAEVGVAAGLGVKAAMGAAGKTMGKITVLGTPAEEGGGGKIDLINKGAFTDIDAAMMAHPSRRNLYHGSYLSIDTINIQFHGKASHAAGFPWEGVNALDAAVLCYSNVSCLRQQMKPTWRVHGIITNGGAKPNIIPELAEMEYYSRAPTATEMKLLTSKIKECAEAAAKATGCTLTFKVGLKPFFDVVTSPKLADLYIKNAARLGKQLDMDQAAMSEGRGSTDMGNVSQVVPGMHPLFFVGQNIPAHTREFQAAAGAAAAQPMALLEGKLLAATAIDLLLQPELVPQMKADLKQEMANRKSSV